MVYIVDIAVPVVNVDSLGRYQFITHADIFSFWFNPKPYLRANGLNSQTEMLVR